MECRVLFEFESISPNGEIFMRKGREGPVFHSKICNLVQILNFNTEILKYSNFL